MGSYIFLIEAPQQHEQCHIRKRSPRFLPGKYELVEFEFLSFAQHIQRGLA